MKKEDKKTLMQAVMASTIGYQVAFAPFIGIAYRGVSWIRSSEPFPI